MVIDAGSRNTIREQILEELKDGEIAVEYTRGIFAKHDASVTKLHLFLGKICTSSRSIDVCGSAITGGDGTAEILLNDFVCLAPPEPGSTFEQLAPPVFFVATPKADSPVSATFRVNIGDGSAMLIKVFTWDPAGNPAGGVAFDWRCCLQIAHIIG